MPWKETCVMDERMRFIAAWCEDEETIAELCRQSGISRKTGNKLIARYRAEGIEGLKDRSRAPHHHPNALSEDVEAAIVAARGQHPTWGAKKILPLLTKKWPRIECPAESTIAAVLARHGLVKPRRRRRHVAPRTTKLHACVAANDVWGIDFKGWFKTQDGRRCDPLTLSDLASRYVLRLQAFDRIGGELVWPVLDAAFREFGLPKVIRSDNGGPFASLAAGGLSRVAVRVIKAGVIPERIDPAAPQQNGRHERMHRTLKAETATPPAANRRQQQKRFDAWQRLFNEERPHESLGQTPPVQHYQPSDRNYSGRLREPDYSDHHEVRRVRQNGEIKWRGEPVFISEVLAGEPIGLEPVADGLWRACFGHVELGLLDGDGKFRVRKAGASPRLADQPDLQAATSVTHVPG